MALSYRSGGSAEFDDEALVHQFLAEDLELIGK
jgi:hypothetical protein